MSGLRDASLSWPITWSDWRLLMVRREPATGPRATPNGVKTNMAKTTGWAPCGQRLVDHAPFGHWRTQTFVAALRHDRLDAPWVIDGAMNAEMFNLYTKTQLVPTLRPRDVVILDNLSSHKSSAAAEALHDRGAWFLTRTAIQPRPQPNRDGLLQTQGADQKSRRPHLRSALGCGWPGLRPLLRRGMLQLLQSRWV